MVPLEQGEICFVGIASLKSRRPHLANRRSRYQHQRAREPNDARGWLRGTSAAAMKAAAQALLQEFRGEERPSTGQVRSRTSSATNQEIPEHGCVCRPVRLSSRKTSRRSPRFRPTAPNWRRPSRSTAPGALAERLEAVTTKARLASPRHRQGLRHKPLRTPRPAQQRSICRYSCSCPLLPVRNARPIAAIELVQKRRMSISKTVNYR